MAETSKTLRRRVRSVGSTRKITRAMEMVSAAKLRRTQTVMNAGRPYSEKLQELLGRLAQSAGEFGHPLFEKREAKKIALVLFTGDRGLCGSFNNNIVDEARQFVKAHPGQEVVVYAMGKKGRDFFRKQSTELIGEEVGMGGKVDGKATRRTSAFVRDGFLSGEYDQVFLLFNTFITQIQNKITLEQYLPLEPEALLAETKKEATEKQAEIDYLFEPGQAEMFARLLPRYLESKMYITLAKALTAEHSARRMAMSNATKNCGELIDALTLKMNKARQAAITKEILEVVSGAEALSG